VAVVDAGGFCATERQTFRGMAPIILRLLNGLRLVVRAPTWRGNAAHMNIETRIRLHPYITDNSPYAAKIAWLIAEAMHPQTSFKHPVANGTASETAADIIDVWVCQHTDHSQQIISFVTY
jgi:hypothetical protein